MSKKVFMYLDDDNFHVDRIRAPRIYYPLIGKGDLLDYAYECDIVKFTTVEGAIDYIERCGCPDFISFDNDLQRDLEGYDLAKYIVEKDMDNPGFIPENFDFFVHSQNNIAKEKIINYLVQYLTINNKKPKLKFM